MFLAGLVADTEVSETSLAPEVVPTLSAYHEQFCTAHRVTTGITVTAYPRRLLLTKFDFIFGNRYGLSRKQ